VKAALLRREIFVTFGCIGCLQGKDPHAAGTTVARLRLQCSQPPHVCRIGSIASASLRDDG